MSCVVDVSTIVVVDSPVYLSTRCLTVVNWTLSINFYAPLNDVTNFEIWQFTHWRNFNQTD